MIVRLDGRITGTVGGSAVEALVIEDAKRAIQQGKARRVEYDLDDAVEKSSTGMMCGGKMEFFIEPLKRVPRLYIFGGGHVALPLANMAAELGYPYTIFDDRPEFATKERFPHASERHAGPFEELIAGLELISPAFIIIVTRSHDFDLAVLHAVLRKPYDYLGMICSKKKKAEMFKKLKDEGFKQKELDPIHAPIGLDIGSKTPAEIAVSILAEVISVYQKGKKVAR